jgi:hypothetical protein
LFLSSIEHLVSRIVTLPLEPAEASIGLRAHA